MRFYKYQALGNGYLVLEVPTIDPATVRLLCDRNFGIGADGILLRDTAQADRLALRILNPDGSEAEKSGNGLRIFARYLHDQRVVGDAPFAVHTAGGEVRCQVLDGGRSVFVEMGTASFDSQVIPVLGPPREVLDEPIVAGDARLRFTAVSMGNPHCVVHVPGVAADLAKRLGPLLENNLLFPNRTNVQFVQVLDRQRIAVEIWERGAGYTLASGSSSCAAAAASVRLGLCDRSITVVMPGGELQIGVGDSFEMTMQGAVAKVAEGTVAEDLLR
jgi:diaminopimelate epimerase